MKAVAIFCKNYDERQQAEDLDIKLPEFIPAYEDFYFNMEYVEAFYKNDEGNINLVIQGNTWSIKWDEKIYNQLINKMK